LRPDFRRIHDLLAECLRADPGNILYLDALLANLRRRNVAGRSRSWLTRWFAWPRRPFVVRPAADNGPNRQVLSTQYSVLSTSYSVLQEAANLLWREPTNVPLFQELALAASECDFDEVELRYLAAAREIKPDDPETLKMLARALTRQGRFDDAVGPWFAVLALAPDAEAQQATEDLTGAAWAVNSPLHDEGMQRSDDAQTLVRQARAMQTAGDFSSAEKYFAQAQAACGGDLALLHEREELRLRHSEDRLLIARRRAASDTHPKAQALVARLEEEHNRLEIDILNMRAERLPQAADVRIELARRLKRAGNFSGAIQRLEEAARLKPNEATVLIELGECWQHLRQFAKALDYYNQAAAVAAAEAHAANDDVLKLARYRAAVLATSMGKTELAREHLGAIVAVDPDFKDARERLDKLPAS